MEKGVISGTAAHDMGQKWPSRPPFVGKWVGYTAHDPIEDTESCDSMRWCREPLGYTAHDPIEDTESLSGFFNISMLGKGYTAHDPIEDTESSTNPRAMMPEEMVTLPTIR